MSRRSLPMIFALLALSAATAWAQSQVRIVRLSYVEGDVQLDRNTGEGFTKAFLNLPIVQGARVSTGADGFAEAELEDGSAIRLAPNSILEFSQLERDNTGTQTTVDLTQGEAYFQWNQNHHDAFRVRVGDQLFTPKKKSHFRITLNGSESALAVFNGELDMFRSNGEKVEVKKNETLSLTQEDPDRYYLDRTIATDALDQWDHERQSDLEREIAAQQNAYANLNQYGSYITVPDYGQIWRPTGFAYGWSPFQDGSWVYYPTCGYVWVSSYPWGWAPYRYGSWVFVNNVGWGWRPGPWRGGWNTAPVFIHPPGGYHPPVPPRHHDGVILVGRPPSDFDFGHRDHHPIVVGATNVSATPSTNTSGMMANQPRPVRPIRANDPLLREDSDRAGRLNGAAAANPTSSAAAPPASQVVSTPRPSRIDRTPMQASAPGTGGRSSVAAPSSAPTYTPPPQRSAPPAPRYEPPPQRSAPAPSYSPPARTYSPPPAPAASAPAHTGGDKPK
jgi:uncharacterized protein DUF6600/FecR-like protein